MGVNLCFVRANVCGAIAYVFQYAAIRYGMVWAIVLPFFRTTYEKNSGQEELLKAVALGFEGRALLFQLEIEIDPAPQVRYSHNARYRHVCPIGLFMWCGVLMYG